MTRLLVTGGAGFIGSHFVDYLLKNTDVEIVCLDKLDFSGNLNRLHDTVAQFPKAEQKRVKFVWHDLRAELTKFTSNIIGPVDTIVHIAAQSHVDRSITHPMEFVLDNVVGTVNLLNYARTVPNLDKFLYFNTDEMFGSAPPGVEYSERSRYNSRNPYSASKGSGAEFCVAYRNTYDLPVFITHTQNVIGLRQHTEKFLPKVIRRVRDDQLIQIHADLASNQVTTRHYIHADDVSDAVWFVLNLNQDQIDIASQPDFGGATCPKFNIVGKEEISNVELVNAVAVAQNKQARYELVDFANSTRRRGDLRYALSGALMKSLGWETKTPIQDRIAEITKWSLEHPEWIDYSYE